MNTAVVTIISHHHAAQARTLLQSLGQHEPGWDRYALVVDLEPAMALFSPEEATLLSPKSLSLPYPDLFFYRYSRLEACTAVKPWVIEHLLDLGYQAVIYLDSDIKVYSPLAELEQALAKHEILLTPHTLAPYPDDELPHEATIRLSGIFNLGFAVFRDSEKARVALNWWKARTLHQCRVAPPEGIFLDQSWMDFAPHYFGASSFTEPGYNVAYWNLHERSLEPGLPVPLVNGKPLRFMHFSGFDPDEPRQLSRHQTRFKPENLPQGLAELLDDYRKVLVANRRESALEPLSDKTGTGLKIPSCLLPALFHSDFVERFDRVAPNRSERDALIVCHLCRPDPEYDRLPLFIGRFYASRASLRRTYPDMREGESIRDFLNWFESCGRREGGFDGRFPTFGWWTKGLSPLLLVKLFGHRKLFDAGLR